MALCLVVSPLVAVSNSTRKPNGHVTAAATLAGTPSIERLQVVTHLPNQLPQRISSIAYDGQKIWAMIYQGHGKFAWLEPGTNTWKASDDDEKLRGSIRRVAGAFESPGGICFGAGKMWVGGSYGDSFGAIDTESWSVDRLFKGKQQNQESSQSYSSIAFDGAYLWIAWHWNNYDLSTSETQRLLKVDPQTGKVVKSYPLPEGSAPDMTHGLAWDGQQLWHIKDTHLSAIDPANGEVKARYTLDLLRRPSGLAWDGQSLWISEFEGRILRLPFNY